MPKTVAIAGFYGYKNLGDSVILEGFRHLFKGWNVQPLAATEQSQYPIFDYDVINNSDLFVLGGGELIYSDRLFFYSPLVRYASIPAFAHRVFNFTSWVKHVKVPKVILGCGVNAVSASQLAPNVVRDLALFGYIGVRDNASLEILQSFPQLKSKVDLFYDLAFQNYVDRCCRRQSDLAVVIPTDRANLKIVEQSRGWLQKSLEPYGSVVFLPFGQIDNDDYRTCQALASCHSNSVILEPSELSFKKVTELLSSCQMVYPYRLHGLILSFMAGANYDFYPYHRKLDRVHRTLTGCSIEAIKLKQETTMKELTKKI